MNRYAILFPQFYRIRANDTAWGNGFTDWALIAAANAFGSWNRRAPERGFYDLSDSTNIKATFDLAYGAGLDGFGIYHYRFVDGPELDSVECYLLQNDTPSAFKYFLIWANESWSKRWAGKDTEILKHVPAAPTREQVSEHVAYLRPHMERGSYAKINDRPIFVIYRPDFFRNATATTDLYREEFKRVGIDPLIGFFLKNAADAQYTTLYDFCYLFEPRLFFNSKGLRSSRIAVKIHQKLNHLMPYAQLEALSEIFSRLLNRRSNSHSFSEFLAYLNSAERKDLLHSLKCPVQNILSCGWNNAPRYRENFTELQTPTSEQFSAMLRSSLNVDGYSQRIPLLCNAWNEWSEGAAIEPCYYLGDRLLMDYLSLPEVNAEERGRL